MSKTQHILLLRHGQTDANALGRLQGHQPTPLNLTGIRQANLLAQRLAGFSPPIEAIISSDLPRATETAAPIAAACSLSLKIDPAWRERSFGLLEGKPVGDKKLWEVASGEADIPGAEPAAELHQRIRDALLSIPENYPDLQTVAVVTHGGPLRSILKMLTDGGLPITRGEIPSDHPPLIMNCSILHLMARSYPEGVRWKIDCINDVSHLREMM